MLSRFAMTKNLILIAASLFAAGCRKDEPPAPTAHQSDQLNDAEAMLNAMADDQPTMNNEASEISPTTTSNGVTNRSHAP